MWLSGFRWLSLIWVALVALDSAFGWLFLDSASLSLAFWLLGGLVSGLWIRLSLGFLAFGWLGFRGFGFGFHWLSGLGV